MFKELTKLSISGSAISGVILIDLQPKDIPAKEEKVLLEKIKSSVTSIKSMEDIALYEKASGCSFVFSDSEKTENLYTGEAFLKELPNLKTKESNLTLSANSIFEWANSGIQHCNNNVVTIFKQGDVLRFKAPAGGW